MTSQMVNALVQSRWVRLGRLEVSVDGRLCQSQFSGTYHHAVSQSWHFVVRSGWIGLVDFLFCSACLRREDMPNPIFWIYHHAVSQSWHFMVRSRWIGLVDFLFCTVCLRYEFGRLSVIFWIYHHAVSQSWHFVVRRGWIGLVDFLFCTHFMHQA
jgi:hypothetical protein